MAGTLIHVNMMCADTPSVKTPNRKLAIYEE